MTDNSRNWRFRAELAEYVVFWLLVFILVGVYKFYSDETNGKMML